MCACHLGGALAVSEARWRWREQLNLLVTKGRIGTGAFQFSHEELHLARNRTQLIFFPYEQNYKNSNTPNLTYTIRLLTIGNIIQLGKTDMIV